MSRIRARRAGRDLEPDDVAEPAPAESCLHRLEHVVGVARQRDVGVPGDAEEGMLLHPYVADERGQEVQDRRLDRDEHSATAGVEESRHVLRHIDADEPLLMPVGDENADVEGKRRNVRKGCSGPACDRREEWQDLQVEPLRERPELARPAARRCADADAGGREGRLEVVAPECVLRALEREDRAPQLGERLGGRAPVRRRARHAGRGLLVELGHPHGDELVEVRRDDAAELDAFEERQRAVGSQLEHAPVEVEPGQLAVREPRGRRPPSAEIRDVCDARGKARCRHHDATLARGRLRSVIPSG